MVGARVALSQNVEEALQEIACVGTNMHKEDTWLVNPAMMPGHL